MKPDPKLDGLLRQWSARHVSTDPASLNEALHRRLAADRFSTARAQPPPGHIFSYTRVWPMLALCSLMAVAYLGIERLRADRPMPTLAPLSSADLDARAKLYRGVQDLFGDKLTGIDLTSNQLQMKLAGDTAAEARDPARPLIVRLAAVESDGKGGWRAVWQRELITLPREVVRLPANGSGDLLCWICPAPDGSLIVDVQLQGGKEGDATCVVKPGEPVELMTYSRDGRSTRILQNIDWLPAADGAKVST